ncbi:MAG TPA: prepilin-type N-terminal cleavage/methylation domain-containing protein [Polyangiaceae bacterium]|jgi:type IV pilus assembly protein PilV|nr:prepilin-type N-terminal cleavage/methylation domain-containing protein [Polyangiaceae bacterium]
MSRSPVSRRLARGYTIVELVMSLAVLAIGASGVIAMQKVAVSSNRHAKDLSIASRIGEGWADQLALDGSVWTITAAGASTLPNTTWLKLADPAQTVEWFIPDYSTLRNFGPAFGALGAPLDPATNGPLIRYCTHLRFAYLHAATGGTGVIRAQIRVFWPADNSAFGIPAAARTNLCAVDGATLTANISAFNVIYLTTSVSQAPVGLL